MGLFILLAVLLVAAIIFFIAVAVFLSHISVSKFDFYCEKLVKRIAKKSNLLSLTNLNITNFDSNNIRINHVIFGKKYIYLISDFKLNGFVHGDVNDKSWIYYNRKEKKHKYIVNLNELADENINQMSSLLGINSDPFSSICLISNNCDFRIKNQNLKTNHMVHYLSLGRKIRKLEKSKIDSLDEKQIYEEYKTIEEASKQSSL